MVAVLIACEDGKEGPPSLKQGQIIKLALPKTSYCKKQPPIWLSRNGYTYDFADELPPLTPEQSNKAKMDQVVRYVASQL